MAPLFFSVTPFVTLFVTSYVTPHVTSSVTPFVTLPFAPDVRAGQAAEPYGPLQHAEGDAGQLRDSARTEPG